MQHVECLWLAFGFAGPVDARILHTVLRKEVAGTTRGKYLIPLLLKHTRGRKHVHFLLRSTGRKQDIFLWNTISHGEHRLENGAGSIAADATHLARACHIHTQYRVGLLQTVEGELARLDAYVIQIEQILVRLLYRNAEHHLRGKFNKVYLQHLADKRERTAGTEVALNHLDVVLACQILDIERTGDVQLTGNLAADALDAAHRLHIQLLWRELDSGVTGMHSGKLDMLTDGVRDNLSILRHSIHLHLLGMLNELAHHYGMFLADIRRQLQEAFQLLPVGTDVHRSAGQYVGRTDQYREAHLIHKGVDVLQGGQRPPFGLVYTNAVEHGGELVTVFGIVDAPGACAENRYLLRIEAQGKVIRYLTTGRDNHPVGILQFENIHHALEGELVEVKTVAHVIVRRHGFGVVVYHDTAVAFLADGVQGLHAAPVELYGRTDAVGAGAQYDNGLAVAEVTDIICRATIR